ncbi:hypothetical protein FCH28_32925, partial [Streptomyces piniterrae]
MAGRRRQQVNGGMSGYEPACPECRSAPGTSGARGSAGEHRRRLRQRASCPTDTPATAPAAHRHPARRRPADHRSAPGAVRPVGPAPGHRRAAPPARRPRWHAAHRPGTPRRPAAAHDAAR